MSLPPVRVRKADAGSAVGRTGAIGVVASNPLLGSESFFGSPNFWVSACPPTAYPTPRGAYPVRLDGGRGLASGQRPKDLSRTHLALGLAALRAASRADSGPVTQPKRTQPKFGSAGSLTKILWLIQVTSAPPKSLGTVQDFWLDIRSTRAQGRGRKVRP